MSKLEELIQELCPNGVEYKKLKELAEVGTGSSNGNEAIENGTYPFFIRSQTIKSKDDYEYDEEAIIIPGEGGIGEIFHYINGRYALHQRVYRIHFLSIEINTKFVYHFMKAHFKKFILKKAVSATVTSIRKPMIEDFVIPIPPLPVQEEIVRILDEYSEKTKQLIDELSAELEARKKQYEYYRDSMLVHKSTAEWFKLGDVCNLVTGATPSKSKKEYWEHGTIPWMNSGEVNLKRVYSTESKITKIGYDSASTTLVPVHSVVIALAGQGKTRGKVAITEIELCTNQSLCSMICNEKLNYKYLYYCLDSQYNNLRAISNGDGTRGGLSLRILSPYQIPVPSLEEQERIVNILDRFDELSNDITSGLTAEIEARQKQYEYYRDKLLIFKPLVKE